MDFQESFFDLVPHEHLSKCMEELEVSKEYCGNFSNMKYVIAISRIYNSNGNFSNMCQEGIYFVYGRWNIFQILFGHAHRPYSLMQ